MSARSRNARALGTLSCVLAVPLALGCAKKKDTAPAAGATPSASSVASAPPFVPPAPIASGLPDPKGVSTVVNPLGEQPYAGPVGTVRGRVVMKGDLPYEQPGVLAKIPAECGPAAREAYGKLFREGPGRTVADVLVAVTGYKGYVPAKAPAQRIVAKECFWGTRTIALTYGQILEVSSGDALSYVPELMGEHGQPQLVATPGNDTPSPLYPTRVGRYLLIDNLRLFQTAEVLVLKYATHAVTGLDGRFEIPGVPVGPVSVNALLPATSAGAQQQVTVEAGKPTDEIVFELTFDAAAFKAHAAGVDGGAPAPSSVSTAGSPIPGTKAPGSKAGVGSKKP